MLVRMICVMQLVMPYTAVNVQSCLWSGLDFTKISRLDFAAPDRQKYPSIDLAYQVMHAGGLMGAAFNAAKEKALDAFLDATDWIFANVRGCQISDQHII